jgi:hypothetical protein
MNPVFMTWEGSCITPERTTSPPPHKKGRGAHGMYLFPGGEGSDSDDDTGDSYDEFDDRIEEEIDDTMEQEDMEGGSFDEAEYDDEEEEEEDEEEEESEEDEEEYDEEEEEEEEEEEMECADFYGASTLCEGSPSTTGHTTGCSGYVDRCSNNPHARLSDSNALGGTENGLKGEEEVEVEMAFDVDVSSEEREEKQKEQGSAQNATYGAEGAVKYRTVSNVGVEGSSNDRSRDEEKMNTENEVENEVEEVAEKRAKVRTVTEDLTTPVCASRLLPSSSSNLHFVTPDSSLSRNNGLIIQVTTEGSSPDTKTFDEKTKTTKKTCVEVESTTKQSTTDNDKKDRSCTLDDVFEIARRDTQKEREISVHVIGVIQEYVINTYMTELSLACLSNLIATDLQVCLVYIALCTEKKLISFESFYLFIFHLKSSYCTYHADLLYFCTFTRLKTTPERRKHFIVLWHTSIG